MAIDSFQSTTILSAVYFVYRRASDLHAWNTATPAFEAWNDTNFASYTIAATQQGTSGLYTLTTPSGVASADYTVSVYTSNSTPSGTCVGGGGGVSVSEYAPGEDPASLLATVLGTPAASVSADIAAVKTDTGNLATRITSTRAGYLDDLPAINTAAGKLQFDGSNYVKSNPQVVVQVGSFSAGAITTAAFAAGATIPVVTSVSGFAAGAISTASFAAGATLPVVTSLTNSVNVAEIGGTAVALDGNGLLEVDVVDWAGTAVGGSFVPVTLSGSSTSGNPAAVNASFVVGADLYWQQSITANVSSAGWTQMTFAIKANPESDQAANSGAGTDADALILLRVTNGGSGSDGLLTQNGAAASSASLGSLAVALASGSTTVTWTLSAAAMNLVSSPANQAYTWEVTRWTSGRKERLGTGSVTVSQSVLQTETAP